MAAAANSDVVVVGSGPAGSTVARLLAAWGYRVTLLHRPARTRALAETLPPSICRTFALTQIPEPSFYKTQGNTVCWSSQVPRLEQYGDNSGYQVERAELDNWLLSLASEATVRVTHVQRIEGIAVDSDETAVVHYDGKSQRARFVLDCTGRAGMLARSGYREYTPGDYTLALHAMWRCATRRTGQNDSNTLIESYEDGWAWSVPVSATLRQITFMVDSRLTNLRRDRGLASMYTHELGKTRMMQEIARDAELSSAPAACDASLYHAGCYAGRNFLLVGDAGSFIDPLSSFGVKKALSSAWLAAVVVNTCISHPDLADVALRYFERCERESVLQHRRQAAALYREAALSYHTPFWERRAEWIEPPFYEDAEMQAAFELLRSSESISLRRSNRVCMGWEPMVQGREVVLQKSLLIPELPPGMRFLRGVDLAALTEISEAETGVPGIVKTYNTRHPAVALPNLLGALSLLIAKQVLQPKAMAS